MIEEEKSSWINNRAGSYTNVIRQHLRNGQYRIVSAIEFINVCPN